MTQLSPEQQLRNVAEVLREAVTSKRHQARAEEIRGAALQLVSMLNDYLDGQLKPVETSEDVPF